MVKLDKNAIDMLRSYIEKLCEIEESNLSERLIMIPKRQHDLFIRYVYESKQLGRAEIEMKKMYGDLYKKFKYDDDRNWDTKGEIESQIYSDPKYQRLWIDFNNQKYIVEELEGFLANLKSLYYNIKELIGWFKFQAGVY